MITPKYLKKGNKIAITCPARKVSMSDIGQAKDLLSSWGLEVILGDTIDKASNQFGGTDRQRTTDMQSFLDNDDIKAIWCARGGYGTVRIIDKLDFSSFVKHPKWIIGYSDITVLLSHLTHLGIEGLHAAMPYQIDRCSPGSIEGLRKALFGEKLSYHWKSNSLNDFSISGILVGGNLSILCSLIGSSSAVDTKGKILFIEDVDEYLYHIDRMMTTLSRGGYLSGLRGLVVGGMTQMRDNNIPFGYSAVEIITSHTQAYGYPVVFNAPIGHQPDNHALYIGRDTHLLSQSGSITIRQ